MDKILTFIIVTWNSNDTIIECLDSIYKFCKNFKIVIVDNKSDDNTVELLNEKKYSDCKIIALNENVGFAEGNNIGLKEVDTPYICYLNPDTILLEDIIVPSIEKLTTKKEIGLVGCKLLNRDKTLQSSTFNFVTKNQVYIECFRIGKFFPNFIREKFFPNTSKSRKNKFVDWVIGAEMILTTEDARKVGGFSTEYYMYAEDMDLCKKIETNLNKKTYYLADVNLIHIGGASEVKNVNYNKLEKVISNKIKFSNKFYGKKESVNVRKALYNSYLIRYVIIKIFCWNKKRLYYLEKMKTGLEICKKISIN